MLICKCGRVRDDRKVWTFPRRVAKRIIKRAVDKERVDFSLCPMCLRASQS